MKNHKAIQTTAAAAETTAAETTAAETTAAVPVSPLGDLLTATATASARTSAPCDLAGIQADMVDLSRLSGLKGTEQAVRFVAARTAAGLGTSKAQVRAFWLTLEKAGVPVSRHDANGFANGFRPGSTWRTSNTRWSVDTIDGLMYAAPKTV